MSNTIQAQVAKAALSKAQLEFLAEAHWRNHQEENDGCHRYVTIKKGLQILCQVDRDGNLLPSEVKRIAKIKCQLNIK